MLTVACVLRSGGIYDPTWVGRLKNGVARHLSTPHRFVCLSDVDVPCERIPLEHDWPGWWAKIEMFKLRGPVLFLDLDTGIVGSLDETALAAQRSRFTMLRDFYAPTHFGSGVMAWGSEPPAGLYEKFLSDPTTMMREQRARMGDQAFIEESVDVIEAWQDVVPGQIVSYKVHCRGGESPVPPNARIVCLHGKPKFADMPPNDAVRIAWEHAA